MDSNPRDIAGFFRYTVTSSVVPAGSQILLRSDPSRVSINLSTTCANSVVITSNVQGALLPIAVISTAFSTIVITHNQVGALISGEISYSTTSPAGSVFAVATAFDFDEYVSFLKRLRG